MIAVGLGGGVGTLARAGLEALWPHDAAHLPGATLTVNLTGALLLGILTGFLSASALMRAAADFCDWPPAPDSWAA